MADRRGRLVRGPIPFGMIAETLREKLDCRPFEAFIVRASSGHAHKVTSPDLVVLMRTKVFIAEARSDRAATIPYLHITAIEEPGNGHRAARRSRKH